MHIIIKLIAAILLMTSVSAFAVKHHVSDSYYYNGHLVYAVKLHNDRSYKIFCKLTADNGAYYTFWIAPYSWSYWKRINDVNAHFVWECKRKRF